jgi:hypothetical protein
MDLREGQPSFQMQIMNMKWISIGLLTLALQLTAIDARATLNLNSDPKIVGAITPGTPAGDSFEVNYVTQLLQMGASSSVAIGGNTFTTSSTDYPYNGAVVMAAPKDESGNTTVGPGYLYVLAKYGRNDVVYYLGGNGMTLPQTGSSVFGNDNGLSHFSVFNAAPVPEPTTILAGALLLLPFGASLLRMRRWKR